MKIFLEGQSNLAKTIIDQDQSLTLKLSSFRNLQTCAWSNNGRSLAVAVEDSLCIFSWTDFDKPDQFSFVQWSSLELTGKIKCIVPWQMFSFIIAKELPLEKLCGNSANDGDMFEIENISHTHQNGQDSCGVSTCNKSGYEDADFAILTQRADRDFTSLLKLKLRKQQCKAQASLAEVIVICYKDPKPRAICRTSIEGLISPDLMLFQVGLIVLYLESLYFYIVILFLKSSKAICLCKM